MTYCVGVLLKDGMVLASDTRTNAGLDHISVFKKMYTFGVEGERVIILMTAGNLATSQAVVNRLRRDIRHDEGMHLLNIPSLSEAADMIGNYATEIAKQTRHKSGMSQDSNGFGSTFLLAGQIKGHGPRLYMIYNEGNSIYATRDTPFFQIGESKYGKPILDRAIHYESDINDAVRAVLVSFDSTVRSNLSVGFPMDLMVYHNDSLKIPKGKRLTENDPYFHNIRSQWSQGLLDILRRFDTPPADYLE
ncbi:peptidase [Pelistega europaea]|uniref:Peptidase n=1 Tax=Pelistega europaea TaxID=106147 RepID=A0A7Y4LCJ5_9BURK|nr:peptidase [Pelistega europaea]NOL49942.1 peptidase [Pelistega europaea]